MRDHNNFVAQQATFWLQDNIELTKMVIYTPSV